MKKATAKKKPVPNKKAAAKKKAAPAKKASPVKKAATAPNGATRPLERQPQSKLQAAAQAGVFLYTDDAWSLAYFNSSDLHCEERELFG
jgi:hypothetical protein